MLIDDPVEIRIQQAQAANEAESYLPDRIANSAFRLYCKLH